MVGREGRRVSRPGLGVAGWWSRVVGRGSGSGVAIWSGGVGSETLDLSVGEHEGPRRQESGCEPFRTTVEETLRGEPNAPDRPLA